MERRSVLTQTDLTLEQKEIILNSILAFPLRDLFEENQKDGFMPLRKLSSLVKICVERRFGNTENEIVDNFIDNCWTRWEHPEKTSIKLKIKGSPRAANYETLVKFMYDMINKNRNWKGPAEWETREIGRIYLNLLIKNILDTINNRQTSDNGKGSPKPIEEYGLRFQLELTNVQLNKLRENWFKVAEENKRLRAKQNGAENLNDRNFELNQQIDQLNNKNIELQAQIDQLTQELETRAENEKIISEVDDSPHWNTLELLVMKLRLYGDKGRGMFPKDIAKELHISEKDVIKIFEGAHEKFKDWLEGQVAEDIYEDVVFEYLQKRRAGFNELELDDYEEELVV